MSELSNERTVSEILFRTFALRIVVALTQSSLLALQGQHPQGRSFQQQIALYTILPVTALADYIAQIIQFFASLKWNRTRRTIQFVVLQLAGVRIRIDGETGGQTSQLVSLRACDSRKIIRQSVRAFKQPQKVRLERLGQILAAAASFVGCLFVVILVVRRIVLVLHSWLLLDFWNGLAALNGCIAAFHVILILMFGPALETWTYPPEAALRVSRKPTNGLGIPTLLMISYPANALFFNFFHVFHHRLLAMIRGLLWALLLPISSRKPYFEGFTPLLFVALCVGTWHIDWIRKSKTPLIWVYWAAFGLMVFNDLWLIYGCISDEVYHAREGYPGETFHNWIWVDEMRPYMLVY
ncbi:hypothetical protein EJ05DRAFT_473394 [Pseudovirgaria hyperparasitica]|uniref:Uncharacterized protein n=1 Tax=Pseudovirgaria hyperparasitica TaxID=470096 RepID=A0A6A6WDZ3_9PEZI|nr:uncharacterized protein EJ05DRAFT_473394 [Pseudovirgaria hyperparasitica]KAF2760785.1 hypothetical protein EJ05DRAFT_473394 [Pseudovirgaria hyperparasitica]